MKKFVRFMLVVIIVIVSALLILGLVTPTDIIVSRSAIIKSPREAVFEQMVRFKNWPNWSPWYKMDTAMKITYAGTDGEPGSSYHWVGDPDKVGEGEMKSDDVKGTQMGFTVTFTEPRRGLAKGILKAEDTAGYTKATLSFSMHMPFPLNAMTVFVKMDKLLGGDFESGLANMKAYTEAHTPAAAPIEVKEVDFPAHVYQGMRKTVKMDELMQFFGGSQPLAKDLGTRITGPMVGIYYTWDTVNMQTDVAMAFPVTDTTTVVKGASIFHAGPGRAAMAVHKGGYSGLPATHMAIGKYVGMHGKVPVLTLEEYLVGMATEPDSNKWITNIYYLMQ